MRNAASPTERAQKPRWFPLIITALAVVFLLRFVSDPHPLDLLLGVLLSLFAALIWSIYRRRGQSKPEGNSS